MFWRRSRPSSSSARSASVVALTQHPPATNNNLKDRILNQMPLSSSLQFRKTRFHQLSQKASQEHIRTLERKHQPAHAHLATPSARMRRCNARIVLENSQIQAFLPKKYAVLPFLESVYIVRSISLSACRSARISYVDRARSGGVNTAVKGRAEKQR